MSMYGVQKALLFQSVQALVALTLADPGTHLMRFACLPFVPVMNVLVRSCLLISGMSLAGATRKAISVDNNTTI